MEYKGLEPGDVLSWITNTLQEAGYVLPNKGQKIGDWIDKNLVDAMEWFTLIFAIEIQFGISEIEEGLNSNMEFTFEEFTTALATIPDDSSGNGLLNKLSNLCRLYHEYQLEHSGAKTAHLN